VVVDFPGVTGIKRRPTVLVSSDVYHSARPDVIVGLITSQVAGSIGSTDHALADWSAAGLRLPSLFRSFLVTLPIPDLAIARDVRRDRLDRSVRSVDQADSSSGGRRPELASRRRPPQGHPLAGGRCKNLVDCIKEGPYPGVAR
jgi:hypothetical protein